MNLINPAYAGSEGSHVFSLTSRNQWDTIDYSPKTTGFSYSMATNKNVGLGVSVISDKIFIENQTTLTIDFSYKLTLSNESALFLGIKGGGNSYSADPTPLEGFTNIPDPAQKTLSRFNPNMGVGFLLKMNQSRERKRAQDEVRSSAAKPSDASTVIDYLCAYSATLRTGV